MDKNSITPLEFNIKIPEGDILKSLIENKNIFIFSKQIEEEIKKDFFIANDKYKVFLFGFNQEIQVIEKQLVGAVSGDGLIHSGIKGILFFLSQNNFKLNDGEILFGTTRNEKVVLVVYKKGKYFFDLVGNKEQKINKGYLMALDILVD